MSVIKIEMFLEFDEVPEGIPACIHDAIEKLGFKIIKGDIKGIS